MLPVEAILPALRAALAEGTAAVLIAPPGAGKTTMVAPSLLGEPWCTGQILLLSPRRLAARAAAERIAELLGEPVGQRVGYQSRMDSRTAPSNRIVVMTGGIFVNRIQDDPELAGVSAVLFDEVHERSLESDFGLALAIDSQNGFRPDLRLLAMSATLDGASFAALLGKDEPAPVLESAGTQYPLSIRYRGRSAERPIEEDVTAAIRQALRDEAEGDLLAFLPGVAEIERTARRLESAALPLAVLPLHGALGPAEQRRALRPDPDGRRRVILATSIAETSLTLDGVRVVIDSGLARRSRFDRAAGVARLVTERVSAAAATQRAGRAARQGAGVAYRLWEEAGTAGLPPFDPPAILESDLAGLALECLAWGEQDPQRLRWLDPPPEAGIAAARAQLNALGALNEAGNLTDLGRAMARLAQPPAIAAMLLKAAAYGAAAEAARLALLLQERGLGGPGEDLERRLERLASERGTRADAARTTAARWAREAESLSPPRSDSAVVPLGVLLAWAYPDRLAKRKDALGERWQAAGGRAYRLDPQSPLSRAEWLAVGEVQGRAAEARVLSAVALDEATVMAWLAERITARSVLHYDGAAQRVEARLERRLGSIVLAHGPDPAPDREAVAARLAQAVRETGLALLPWPERSVALRQRAAYAGITALDEAALLDGLNDWLLPVLLGKRSLGGLDPAALHQALEGLLDWNERQAIDRLAPPEFVSPAGTRHSIDYAAPAGPTVTLRVQALFGLAAHPVVGEQRVPLVLSLTSPAARPIQTTRDLPAFWAGSWRDVAKEMRGRYPKHAWPDDPAGAVASLKTKKAQARGA